MRALSRSLMFFALCALLAAFFVTRAFVHQPGFTDAFYHFNAANRIVRGEGMTDAYLWTYIGVPDHLPAPSHLYWMPMTSWTAAFGMALLNAPGSYAAAQWPFALMLAGTALIGFHLGKRLGGSRRHAWMAGLLTLLSGSFTRFWGATDTFAPYALFGALCLVALGIGAERSGRQAILAFSAAGAFTALAHLTRADGVLLLIVGWGIILWSFGKRLLSERIVSLLLMTAAYLVVMLPWFARNLAVIGSPLPVGGTQGIWFTEYNDLFNYPPDSNPASFFADGLARLFSTRWEALTNNIGTFIVVEGMIVLTPLMLIALWSRRRQPFLRGFWLYVVGLHLAMTLIFPFPGYRGGLFHSAAALVPFWAALGVVGLDDVVGWAVKRRRRWRVGGATAIFASALLSFVIVFSLAVGAQNRVTIATPPLYQALAETLPPDARVMLNDPAQLYYFTGHGGVVLPNEAPQTILDIARRYDVHYLLLQGPESTPLPLWSLYQTTPDFLRRLPFDDTTVRLYAIDVDTE